MMMMFSVHMVIRSSLCYKYDTIFSWLLKHVQNMDLLFLIEHSLKQACVRMGKIHAALMDKQKSRMPNKAINKEIVNSVSACDHGTTSELGSLAAPEDL